MPSPSRAAGVAAAAATILIWTAFIVLGRAMALQTLTPADIAACRIAGAGTVLVPWGVSIVARRRRTGDPRPTWLGVSPLPAGVTVPLGVTGGVLYGLIAYTGFVYAPAAHAAVLMPGMLPFFAAVFSVLLLREALGRARLVGLAMILGGAAGVGGVSLLDAFVGGTTWRGDLLFIVGAAIWSFYAVLCRLYRVDAVDATIAVTSFSVLAYLPAYALAIVAGLVESRLAVAPPLEIVFQAVFQGLFSVVVAGTCFVRMVQAFGPLRSTMLTALVPPLSALGAVAFLGEPLGWNLIAGLALVTAGIVVGVRGAMRLREA